MQPCLSDYTISRVVQLKAIVLYCRRNARFPVHTCPPRKFSECAARFLIRPGLLDEFDLPSRQDIMEACEKLEAVHERAFSIIVELSMKYSRQGDRKNRNKTFQKIEQLHQEFTEAQNRALEYLDNRKDDRSSVSTESPKSIRFTGTGNPPMLFVRKIFRHHIHYGKLMTCFHNGNIVGKKPQKTTLNILDQNPKVLMNLTFERRPRTLPK